MKLMAIKKYLKIWAYCCRFSLISATTYRTAFFVELFVEFGYILWAFFLVQIIFSNVAEVAGWNRHQMFFLMGMNLVFAEIFVNLFYVWGFRTIPEKIKNGEIDFVLLKPINSLFALTTGQPYIASFLATIPGIYMMIYSAGRLGIATNPLNIASSVILFLCGMVILYSLSVMVVSLSFVFLNTRFLSDIALKLSEYGQNPPPAYSHIVLKVVFFFIVPAVFMGSLPAAAIVKTVQPLYLAIGTGLAILFLFIAIKMWNFFVRRYSSASS